MTITTIHSHHTAHNLPQIRENSTLQTNEQIILDTFACSEQDNSENDCVQIFHIRLCYAHKMSHSGVFSYRLLSFFQSNRFYFCSFDVLVLIWYAFEYIAVLLPSFSCFLVECSSLPYCIKSFALQSLWKIALCGRMDTILDGMYHIERIKCYFSHKIP